ncbi:MAG: hypothetical protein EU529_00410 [Promethearchaeota archaeon]|nr:MAG: hypothetical protein EU529_00410 [Candidatus Lokiarchaeota archaeon]
MLIWFLSIIWLSLIFFLICLFLYLRKKKNYEILYIIIPLICIGIWALYCLTLVTINQEIPFWDFGIYYYSGRQLLINPNSFYKKDYGYWGVIYLPFFLMLWAISLSLLPYNISYLIWYGLNYIFAILLVLEFNKILKLLGIREKMHRFLFLMVISNGFLIFHQFALNQSKFLVGAILLFILRREIQYNKEEKEKDFKYKFITYFLFCMIVTMAPYFIFLLLIFMFHDIPFGELFKKENLKTYGLVAVIFLSQNFLFFIYPGLILDYFEVLKFYQILQFRLVHYYLIIINEIFIIPNMTQFIVSLILLIILGEIIGFLIITKKLKIHEKFSYFAISFIFLYSLADKTLIILLPLTLLLFIPYFHQDVRGRDFFKKNKYILIGLLSVLGIYLSVNVVNPFNPVENPLYPNIFGGSAGYLIFTVLLGICLLKLHLDKDFYIVERKTEDG